MSKEIATNKKRTANFTSSQIWKLCKSDRSGKGFGAPALTYIKEKRMERKLKRSLDTGAFSKDINWGNFMEMRVFNILGLEYQIKSDETKMHQTLPHWSGSADLVVPSVKIAEIKCYGLKKFCEYAEAIESKDIERIKNDFEAEYWQMVSNAIINQVPNAEAILYLPYENEMDEIREMAATYDGEDQFKYRFIAECQDWELSVMPDDSEYKNLNQFEFEVPKEDVEFLTNRVIEATKLLLE